jgi:hypothetical protein
VPAIFGDCAAISLGGSIDDLKDSYVLVITTGADTAHDGNPRTSTMRIAQSSFPLLPAAVVGGDHLA